MDEHTQEIVRLVTEIARAALDSKKQYFIGGGLAIDLSVSKITRNHHDIDFHPILKDASWWIDWFEKQGLSVKRIEGGHFPETYNIFNQNGEMVVDLWPMDLKEGILFINKDGVYVDAGRYWDETRLVKYNGVDFNIENPQRVLEQKLRHAKRGEPFREQDRHDFKLLDQDPGM